MSHNATMLTDNNIENLEPAHVFKAPVVIVKVGGAE